MNYRTALDALMAVAAEAELPVKLEQAADDPAVPGAVFGAELAGAINANGYPGGAELPWTVDDDFEITAEARDEVQRVVLAARDPAMSAAAARFLLGEL
ncbi:hypothetical protein TPR58_12480 [Sphingomonas sp. HF-S3]|uniref:Uncharacterized protein n=1 Tax=Sphingomonas rustica TaxID=3103142 RepID=A0ABV0B8U2_9SPHN